MALARPRHPGCGGLAGGWPARRLRGPVGGQPWGVSARCRSAASHCRPHRGSATHHAGNARCHCPSGGLSMYVAVKGGEAAILNSYQLLARQRRGDVSEPELSVAQIRQQLKLAVDRVMTEGSVYDPELAALAIKQAAGDLVEAIFLLRACRAWAPPARWTPAAWRWTGASPPPSRTCPAGRCWVPPTTTRSACSISSCWPKARWRHLPLQQLRCHLAPRRA